MLATNPEEQDKLRAELRAAFSGGELQHDAIVNHRYLDQVVSGECVLQ